MPDAQLRIILDGRDWSIPVAAGETLIDAAELNGIELPSVCRSGTCGACAVQLSEGSVSMAATHALSKRDRESGLILACQASPESEFLTINYDL
jgi:ring-1,2-phenylacetyl-CoA epoxidase subunit PaaE